MSIDIFVKSNFVGVNWFFFVVHSKEDDNTKRHRAQRYYLPNGIIKNYNIIINGKKFYDQQIDCDTKRHKEIKKLKTRQGEDCTTGCLLDYGYVKNHCWQIAVDLSRQKELDAYPKAIQQKEFDYQKN